VFVGDNDCVKMGQMLAQRDVSKLDDQPIHAGAALASAEAGVQQARASLNSAQINIARASIRSPISGVVLSRQSEPGQTVAAFFQAPTLLTPAEDLAAVSRGVVCCSRLRTWPRRLRPGGRRLPPAPSGSPRQTRGRARTRCWPGSPGTWSPTAAP
jgi:hypothetical protein